MSEKIFTTKQSMNPREEVCYVVYTSQWFSENAYIFLQLWQKNEWKKS